MENFILNSQYTIVDLLVCTVYLCLPLLDADSSTQPSMPADVRLIEGFFSVDFHFATVNIDFFQKMNNNNNLI